MERRIFSFLIFGLCFGTDGVVFLSLYSFRFLGKSETCSQYKIISYLIHISLGEYEVIYISCVYPRLIYSWEQLYCILLCDSKELFGVCPVVFALILKDFLRKSDVLHFCIYFLVWVVFTYSILFIRRQQALSESRVNRSQSFRHPIK